MRLYLIRHGETVWNAEARYQGHSDVALSARGKKQGELIGKRLAGVSLDAIYASDLSRAYHTAEYIAAWHKLEVKKSPLIRELNFGVWEGLTFQEIMQNYGDLASKWYENPVDLCIPEGEMFADLEVRVREFIDYLKQHYEKKNVAIVSHGGTIRTIICNLLEINLSKMWKVKQDNTCLNIIDFYDQRPVLSLLNDTCHLDKYSL